MRFYGINSRLGWTMMVALLALPLMSCSDSGSGKSKKKAAAPKAEVQVQPKAEEVPPEPVVKKNVYTYSSIGKRDPFRSYLAIEEENKQAVAANERRKTPLEKYTLDQLRLTAIITGTSKPMAMVEDPSNNGWTVHVGTRIGSNGGKISAIMRNSLVITEEYRDAAGRKRKNKVSMSLPADVINLGQ